MGGKTDDAKKRIFHRISIVLFIGFVALTLVAGVALLRQHLQLTRDLQLQQALESGVLAESGSEESQTAQGGALLPKYSGTAAVCPDFAGWLRLPGDPGLSRVVVQTADNAYYLTHNYKGEDSRYGELFLDASCQPKKPSRNLIVYGHGYRNDSQMFGILQKYARKKYALANPTFYFSNGVHEYECTIFAVRRIYPGSMDYFSVDFADDQSFMKYVDSARADALYDLDVTVSPQDNIITLYTCDYTFWQARLLVHAVLRQVD